VRYEQLIVTDSVHTMVPKSGKTVYAFPRLEHLSAGTAGEEGGSVELENRRYVILSTHHAFVQKTAIFGEQRRIAYKILSPKKQELYVAAENVHLLQSKCESGAFRARRHCTNGGAASSTEEGLCLRQMLGDSLEGFILKCRDTAAASIKAFEIGNQ
jgi:hypothetical protein